MLLLWSILLIIIAIALGAIAFSGVAIAVSFFTKLLFLLSFICFIAALVLIIVERIQRKEKNKVF